MDDPISLSPCLPVSLSSQRPAPVGLLLAAGRGRRMGGAKQLAAWPTERGNVPLVAAAYDAIRPACDQLIVVVGHKADAVAAALGDRPFHRVTSDPDADMFQSIRAGLEAARRLAPMATVVLQPADHPAIASTTLSVLTAWSLQRPGHAVMPQHQARGGHPVFVPPPVRDQILQTECPAGLAKFWKAHPQLCHRLPVNDLSVVLDIDTPADLESLPAMSLPHESS